MTGNLQPRLRHKNFMFPLSVCVIVEQSLKTRDTYLLVCKMRKYLPQPFPVSMKKETTADSMFVVHRYIDTLPVFYLP
jgi:hypothetical protein